jgi:hypothetical protein
MKLKAGLLTKPEDGRTTIFNGARAFGRIGTREKN